MAWLGVQVDWKQWPFNSKKDISICIACLI